MRRWLLSLALLTACGTTDVEPLDGGPRAADGGVVAGDALVRADGGPPDATATVIDAQTDAAAGEDDAAAGEDDATVGEDDATVGKDDATVGEDASIDDAATTDAGCTPSPPEVCDGIDNDCNGLIDDVDVSLDGLNDCARIALMGLAGSNGASDFLAWLRSNGVVVDRIHTAGTASITPFLLGQYDVLILDRLVRNYTAPEADLIRGWIEAGGGLISLSGYTGGAPDRDRPDSILAPIGGAYVNGLRSQAVTQFVPHATTSSLSSVTFSGGFRVTTTASIGTSTAVYVASVADGPVALAIERGQGRAFVWGDEWVTFDSEWRMRPDIRQFWVNVLGWVERVR